MMTPYERETTLVASDGDNTVRIFTAQTKYIRQLRTTPGVTEVSHGTLDGVEHATFTVPADRWTPAGGVRRTRNLTPEARAAAGARLAASRRGVAA